MASCINLRETYGGKYRIEHEESHAADRGENSRTDDPWTMIVPCEHGHVGPYGGDELFAATNHSGPVASALRALNCCRVWMDGSDGLNVVFNFADAKKVFALMKPRRRRQLTPEQRERLVTMGRANLKRINIAHIQNGPGERQLIPSGPDVQSHQEATERVSVVQESQLLLL